MSTPPVELLDRALSIRQPYVELILRGMKKVEYRTRVTHVCERVYLYASLTLGDVESGLRQGLTLQEMQLLPRGVIVGSVELTGCRREGDSDYAWLLEQPRRYRAPLRPLGQPQPTFWHPRWR